MKENSLPSSKWIILTIRKMLTISAVTVSKILDRSRVAYDSAVHDVHEEIFREQK